MIRLLLTITIVAFFFYNAYLNHMSWAHPFLVFSYVLLLIWPVYLSFVLLLRLALKRTIRQRRFHHAARIVRHSIDLGVVKKGQKREAIKLIHFVDVSLPGFARRVPLWLLWGLFAYLILANGYVLFFLKSAQA